jgi:hypothetical protein
MHVLETIEIPISKLKIIIMLFGCMLFIVFGISFIISPEKYSSFLVGSNMIIFLIGCLGIVFFGFVGFSIFKRVIDNTPGLIISGEGITDNSSGAPAGFIPWSDIIAVKGAVVANQRFINLVVKNPQFYIDRQKSAFKRKVMQKNYDIFGTAIGISTNSLKINYRELKGILEKRLSDLNTKHI